jgi:Zn-dependent peptidase ImmA (M78 family)
MYYDDTQGITTELVNLPTSVKGFSKANNDMTYTIIINARLSEEQQRNTYKHELEHIKKDDFRSLDNADNIEHERHLIER